MLLHGWPGDRTDYEALAPLLTDRADVIVPDLRGFGDSDKHPEPPVEAYSAAAQARSVVGLIEELGLEAPVIAGYDVGSRIAQAIARDAPHSVRALVVSPPLPGAGDRVLTADSLREFWYQAFHQLPLVEQVLDGDPAAVRAYLAHFWQPLVRAGVRADRGAPRPPRGRLRSAGRDDRLDRVVPRRVGDGRELAGRDRAARSGSPRRRPCCGRATTRSSRARGPTGSTASSATSSCDRSTASATSRRSRRRRRSRMPSAKR